jgi:hemerythrin-like domain-containing protein
MATDPGVRAIFFDIRDTLGVVDRKGHLVKFKPTTDQLLEGMKSVVGLRIGVITNLPPDVPSERGRQMLEDTGIWPFLDPKGFITNHEAKAEKPDPAIFRFAAGQLGLAPEQCLFVGENLLEVLGAQAAGMKATAKPFPPGREFLFQPAKLEPITATGSGRLSERILEEEHLVGKRIVGAAIAIKAKLAATTKAVPVRAMGLLVWLTKHFIDPYHHRKEEEVLIPFSLMRGLNPARVAFVAPEHDQGRAYFRGLELAYHRFLADDHKALGDFRHCLTGFIELYQEHGRKEDDELFKQIGELLTPADDALIVELMGKIGPADVTLYYAAIGELETEVAS